MVFAVPLLVWATVCASVPDGANHAVPVTDVWMREGIDLYEFAGPDMANDIYCMTLDPHGHPTVAGRGYIRTLVDDDGDLRADRVVQFANRPRDGAMGLLWQGADLYVTGDGGVHRFRDRDGDHRADGEPELLWRIKTGGEHDAHALRRGPDGCFYLVAGNFAGVSEEHVTDPESPVRHPIAGCVLRFSPDWTTCAVVADGFRNAYDIAFNSDGELFTYDSDNERCVGLPWYEPTRVYHVVSGGHYGWQSPQKAEFWRMPPWFPDVVPPLAYAGRGSPTGVESAAGCRLPGLGERDVLVADWTFGRILHVVLVPHGASYRATLQPLIQASGGRALAVTDLVVDPETGYLWFCTGGRGTRGAVYVARPAEAQSTPAPPTSPPPVYLRLRRQLEQVVSRGADHVDGPVITVAANSRDPVLRHLLLRALRRGATPVSWTPESALEEALVLLAQAERDGDGAARAAVGRLETARDELARLLLIRALQVAAGDLPGAEYRGHLWEGYSALRSGQPGEWYGRFLNWLSTNRGSLGRATRFECGRLLAMVGMATGPAVDCLVTWMTQCEDVIEQEHYLFCLSRLDEQSLRRVQRAIIDTLVELPFRLDARGIQRDRNWPARTEELVKALVVKVPGMGEAIVAHPRFGAHADHVVLASAPQVPRSKAAQRFYERLVAGQPLEWSTPLVELMAALPDAVQRRKALRAAWQANSAVRDAVILRLAPVATEEDVPALLEQLRRTTRPGVAAAALTALERLCPDPSPELLVALLSAWRNMRDLKPAERLINRIKALSRRAFGEPVSDPDELERHIVKRWPEAVRVMPQAVAWPKWQERLERIDWESGDATRGKELFHRLGCATCHSGARALGPDLRGVSKRFGRDDLFRAIVSPDEVVPERYRTVTIVTRDGRVFQGVVVYDSVAGLVLQTPEGDTVHIRGEDIEQRVRGSASIMPQGLLDGLSDQDLADLYAYLRTL